MKKVPSKAYWSQIVALIPVYIVYFILGTSDGWIPNFIYFFQNGTETSLTLMQCAIIASSNELARIIFSIPVGFLADYCGRRTLMIFCGVSNFLGWGGLSIGSSFVVICMSRLICGLAHSTNNTTSVYFIGEISSPEIRGKLIGFCRTILTAGELFQCIISLTFSSYYIMAYSTFCLSILSLISLFWLMESPNYLISENKYDQAKNILKKLRPSYSEKDINSEFENLKIYIDNERKRKRELSWIKFVKSEEMRTPTITCILLHFFSHGMGIFVLRSYITSVMPENEYIPIIYYPSLSSMIKFFVTLLLPFYIEKFRRKTIFIAGAATLFISFLLITFADYCFSELDSEPARWVFIIFNFLVGLILIGSIQPMLNVSRSEILPQSVKGFGGSLCAVVQCVANVLMVQIYNFFTINSARYYIFTIFSLNSLIVSVLVYFRVPEGRGRFLADLQTGKK